MIPSYLSREDKHPTPPPQIPSLLLRTIGHKTCHQAPREPLSGIHSLLFPPTSIRLLVLSFPNSRRAGEWCRTTTAYCSWALPLPCTSSSQEAHLLWVLRVQLQNSSGSTDLQETETFTVLQISRGVRTHTLLPSLFTDIWVPSMCKALVLGLGIQT